MKTQKQPSKKRRKAKKPRRAPALSSRRITIRLTPAELGILRAQAAGLKLGLAEVVRRLCLRGSR